MIWSPGVELLAGVAHGAGGIITDSAAFKFASNV